MKAASLELFNIKRVGVSEAIFYPYSCSPDCHGALKSIFDVGEFWGKVTVINLHIGKVPEMQSLHALYYVFCTSAVTCWWKCRGLEEGVGDLGGFFMFWKLKDI